MLKTEAQGVIRVRGQPRLAVRSCTCTHAHTYTRRERERERDVIKIKIIKLHEILTPEDESFLFVCLFEVTRTQVLRRN